MEEIIPKTYTELLEMVTEYYKNHDRGDNENLDIQFSQLCPSAMPPMKPHVSNITQKQIDKSRKNFFDWAEKERPLSFDIQPLFKEWIDKKDGWGKDLKITKGEIFKLEESEIFDSFPDNMGNMYSWVCYKVKKFLEKQEGPISNNTYKITVNTKNKQAAAYKVVVLNKPDSSDGPLYQ